MKNHPLTHVLARSRRAIIAVAVFSAGINILILTGTIYMMQIFDRVLTGQSGSTLFFLTVLALFLLSIYGVLELVAVAHSRAARHMAGDVPVARGPVARNPKLRSGEKTRTKACAISRRCGNSFPVPG